MRIFFLEEGAFSSPAPAAFGFLQALGLAAASTVPGTAPTPGPDGAAVEVTAPGAASSCFGGGSCKRKGSCMTPLPIAFKMGSEASRSAYPGATNDTWMWDKSHSHAELI